LIGGHAVAGHAEARLTEDLDVLVEPTTENASRLRDALIAFGFGTVAPAVEQLATPDKVFMLGRKPWRIDILTTIAGVTFDQARDGRVEAALDDSTRIWVIGREALIKNKLAAGPDKDMRDVEALRRYAPDDER
jgi:hypothetical protein